MKEYIDLITNVGLPIALVMYFLYRDSKYMERIVSAMVEIKTFVAHVCEKEERRN